MRTEQIPWARPGACHTRVHLPQAAICFDPFHVLKWAGEGLDHVHLATPRDDATIQVEGRSTAKTWQRVRSALRAAAENLDPTGKAIIDQLRIKQKRLFRVAAQGEPARPLPGPRPQGRSPPPGQAVPRAADRSTINAFQTLGRRIRHHFADIIAAITHRCPTP